LSHHRTRPTRSVRRSLYYRYTCGPPFFHL
jgi:hypothetical protein